MSPSQTEFVEQSDCNSECNDVRLHWHRLRRRRKSNLPNDIVFSAQNG